MTTKATNLIVNHLQRFRDEWLERNMRGYVEVADVCTAYHIYCDRIGIRNRRLPVHRLVVELSDLGVVLGSVRQPIGRHGMQTMAVFVSWRLTRNARYAIRDLPRPAMDEDRYAPISRLRGEEE